MSEAAPAPEPFLAGPSPLAEYKAILKQVLETRPSGTRQRLAEALGKNRSFVSQIANPGYATPVPAQHLEVIFHICHFSARERAAFLAAYRAAHPGRLEIVDPRLAMRKIELELPDFGDPAVNARADHLLLALARGIAGLLQAEGPEEAPAHETDSA